MADRVQAKKDLQFCCDELIKYQNLSRSGLRHSELVAIDNVIIRLKERIKNLRLINTIQAIQPSMLYKHGLEYFKEPLMKHILAEKTNNEIFTFFAAPIPNNLTPQYSVEDKKTLELKHGGEDYAVYCDANLTDNELKKLKHDWEDVDPQSLNIVMIKK